MCPPISRGFSHRLIAIAWEYDPGPPEHYEPRLGPLARNHIPHMVASGVTSWNQIAPDFERSFENIDTFLAVARTSRALGLMNTLWTDDGQMLMRMTWPGIAYGAAAAWQNQSMDERNFFSEYSQLTTAAPAAPEVASALGDLAQAETAVQKVLADDSMLSFWDNPFSPAMLKKCTENQEALHQARMLAEDAEEHLGRARALGADAASLNSFVVAGAECWTTPGKSSRQVPSSLPCGSGWDRSAQPVNCGGTNGNRR